MKHEALNYVEFPARDLEKTKHFFKTVFGWEFTDYGPEYAAFSVKQAGIEGGFYPSHLSFPGGRRFHFSDPSENEWAVWALPES